MSRGNGHSNNFVNWAARPSAIAQEQERREREEAVQVVRVNYDMLDDDAVIYREGRLGLKHQELSPEEKQQMLGAKEGEKVFFFALWSKEETKWNLIERAPASEGW